MSQWTSSFSLIGPTGSTGPAGPEGATGPAGPIGGSPGEVLYNNGGIADTSANLTFDGTTLTAYNATVMNTFDLNGQIFYSHGADGFSVNENFNAGNATTTAYHFTSGSNTRDIIFSIAKTGQFTNMFGTYGTSGLNTFVIGSETANSTNFQIRSGVGIAGGLNLAGGTSVMNLTYDGNVALGCNAGAGTQGAQAVAVGAEAGCNAQGSNAVAIGSLAGQINQNAFSVAIGYQAGQTSTLGQHAIAIGTSAGQYSVNKTGSLAIGWSAGYSNQGQQGIALGQESGNLNQGNAGIAIGYLAAGVDQGISAVAIGPSTGYSNQGDYAVAIGNTAGTSNQGSYCVAIGNEAGISTQMQYATAVGTQAGYANQGEYAVAVGFSAGNIDQGNYAVAIGYLAGEQYQHSTSIVLNASATSLNAPNSGLYIKPLREEDPVGQFATFYNTTTNEVIHNSIITLSTISTIIIGGNLLPDRSLAYSLGTSSLRYTDAFFGPGTVNIAGPSNANATIGTDAQGIIYTQSGFASPFINIGPAQLTPQAVGGWQIGPTGTQGATGYDLVVQEQQANGSGPTGPIYSLIHPVAYSKGAIITVDDIYGNDSLGSPGTYPYKTINAAMTALAEVGALNTIVINPGNYTLTAPITLPANTSVRGISLQTCKISYTATTDTTMITMGENSRIEDLNITLLSSSDVELVGIGFSGTTAQTAKVRTCTVTVDNRSASTAKSVTAVLFNGSNTASTSDFSFNALKGSTINVYSNSSGRVRGVLSVESSIMSTRDMNIYVSSFSAQTDYIGIETLSTAIVELRSSSVSGTTADISQTSGSLQIGPGTDLINRTANGKTFSTSVYPTTIFYGLKGTFDKLTSADGWLWPGTVPVTKPTASTETYPDQHISYYRIQQPAILWGMTTDLGNPVSDNHSSICIAYISTSAYSVATPTLFELGYGDGEFGVKDNFNQSISLKRGDQIALYFSTSGTINTNTGQDLTIQLDLF